MCGESTCWDVYSSYIVHVNLFTQSHYGDELPPRDEVKVKSLVSVQETIGWVALNVLFKDVTSSPAHPREAGCPESGGSRPKRGDADPFLMGRRKLAQKN